MSNPVYKIRLKKGDTVVITAGKEKGKTGKVVSTHPTLNKVTVENINVVKRHVKPTQTNPQGGIIEKTKPLPVSNVAILEPTSKIANDTAVAIIPAIPRARSDHRHTSANSGPSTAQNNGFRVANDSAAIPCRSIRSAA
jgi:large subunit ribosomal protein L24